MVNHYQTDLRCAGCLTSIAPLLDAHPDIKQWSADVNSADKVLSIEGSISKSDVDSLLKRAGYNILSELPASVQPVVTTAAESTKATYYPLMLIVAYILGVVAIIEIVNRDFVWHRAMTHFMAGFFLVFSFFKLLDVQAFATSFASYDLLAARSRAYAIAYPFIELSLGIAYLLHIWPWTMNVITLAIMLLGTAGIVSTLLQRRKVQCACLGTVFNLPMSYVTLIEDLSMAIMAAFMLFT